MSQRTLMLLDPTCQELRSEMNIHIIFADSDDSEEYRKYYFLRKLFTRRYWGRIYTYILINDDYMHVLFSSLGINDFRIGYLCFL
jgi:hypothetical protein